MRFVRSVLLVAACMAAAVSHAQSSGQWRFSMDDARRVTGMTWASNSYSIMQPVVAYDQLTSGNRVEVRRINGPVGNLPQQLVGRQNAFTVTPSGAVVELPTRVRVPGRTLEVPATIIDPVSKSRLSRIGGKALKMLPVVGTAVQLAEFIDEIDVTRKPDGNFYPDAPSGSQISSGYQITVPEAGTNNQVTLYNPDSYCSNHSRKLPYPDLQGYSYSVQQDGPDKQRWNCVFYYPNNFSFSVGDWATKSSCPAESVVVGGQCQSQQPLNEQQLIDRINQLASLDGLIRFLNSLPFNDPNVIDVVAREIKDDPEDQYVKLTNTGSNTIQVGEPVTTTVTNPDGSTVTTTTTTTATAQGNQITFETKTQTVTKDLAGNTTSTSTTTTTPTSPSNPNSPQQEIITCGLPDTPPCKIDETGTPAPPEDDGENKFKSLIPNCLKTDWKKCFPELPDINWAFTLPSGCSPIPVPFGRFGFTEVNICPWQGMIHDIMSMLWAAAGLFGAIGILSGRRNSEA